MIGSIWDNGFLIQYLTDRAVIADGASQFKAGARLFAEAMLQNDSYNAASILNKTTGRREVYLLFTPPDMDYKLGGLIESSGLNVGFTEKTDENTIKIEETLYFKLHVIGQANIECFERYIEIIIYYPYIRSIPIAFRLCNVYGMSQKDAFVY